VAVRRLRLITSSYSANFYATAAALVEAFHMAAVQIAIPRYIRSVADGCLSLRIYHACLPYSPIRASFMHQERKALTSPSDRCIYCPSILRNSYTASLTERCLLKKDQIPARAAVTCYKFRIPSSSKNIPPTLLSIPCLVYLAASSAPNISIAVPHHNLHATNTGSSARRACWNYAL